MRCSSSVALLPTRTRDDLIGAETKQYRTWGSDAAAWVAGRSLPHGAIDGSSEWLGWARDTSGETFFQWQATEVTRLKETSRSMGCKIVETNNTIKILIRRHLMLFLETSGISFMVEYGVPQASFHLVPTTANASRMYGVIRHHHPLQLPANEHHHIVSSSPYSTPPPRPTGSSS